MLLIVAPIVVRAEDQHHDSRLHFRPNPLQQQIFLIGAESRNAGGENPVVRYPGLQQIGEAFIRFGIQTPDEGISEKYDGWLAIAARFLVAQPKAIVLVVRRAKRLHGADGTRDWHPAEFSVEVVGERCLAQRFTQLAEIGDAQNDFQCANVTRAMPSEMPIDFRASRARPLPLTRLVSAVAGISRDSGARLKRPGQFRQALPLRSGPPVPGTRKKKPAV